MTDQDLEELAAVRHDEELRRIALGAAINSTPSPGDPAWLLTVLTRAFAFHGFVTSALGSAKPVTFH